MTKTNQRMNDDSFRNLFTSKGTLSHIVKKYTPDLEDFEISEIEECLIIDDIKDYYNTSAEGVKRKDIRAVCHLECDDALEPERIYYSVNYIEHADENYLREMLKQDCLDLGLTGEMNNTSFTGYSIFFCNVGHRPEVEHGRMINVVLKEDGEEP
ncbi:MAG: hypothetical protein ACI4WM_10690, partial [Erysipelotrichaceae bacterium]